MAIHLNMGRAENIVTRSVEAGLSLVYGQRAVVVRVQAGSFSVGNRFIRGAEAGTADLIGVVDGIPVAIEVKTRTGRQTDTQREWAERWTDAGGLYVLARSATEALEAIAHAADRRRV